MAPVDIGSTMTSMSLYLERAVAVSGVAYCDCEKSMMDGCGCVAFARKWDAVQRFATDSQRRCVKDLLINVSLVSRTCLEKGASAEHGFAHVFREPIGHCDSHQAPIDWAQAMNELREGQTNMVALLVQLISSIGLIIDLEDA